MAEVNREALDTLGKCWRLLAAVNQVQSNRRSSFPHSSTELEEWAVAVCKKTAESCLIELEEGQ